MKPEQLLYAKTHEWVAVEPGSSGEKVATVGVSPSNRSLISSLCSFPKSAAA
jgi:glycine cleavage system H lipoate-binding protein